MVARGDARTLSESIAAGERRLDTATAPWGVWLRGEFLRSCYVAACLAWYGLGILEIRSLLDPWYPGQGASPAWVYAVMIAFVLGSLAVQVLLYRRWWPSGPTVGRIETLNDFQAQAIRKKYL